MEMQRGLSERDLQPWKISGHGAWRKGGGKVEIERGENQPGENFDLGKGEGKRTKGAKCRASLS